MSRPKVRAGELLALAGAVLVIVSLLLRWYEGPSGTLDAWDTFGPAVALLLLAALAALWLFASTLAERTTAAPVAAAVWCTTLGVAALIASIVRLLERPDGATRLCGGGWVALAGALAVLAGAWQAMRDERGSLYPPANPRPRPRP
jgi:uncharacterized membrane protein HdeD (DUF308 family)